MRASGARLVLLVASVLGLAAAGSAGAQPTGSSPTTSVGTTQVSIGLSGTAELPTLSSLALPLDTLVFDLTGSATVDNQPRCLVGASATDVVAGPTATLGPPQLLPAGTTFQVTTFPTVELTGGTTPVGPLPLTDPALACYRTFVMKAFSNSPAWQLAVDRLDDDAANPIRHLYVGAACQDGQKAGMFRMEAGTSAPLVTAKAPGMCGEVLVAVAVKPTSQAGGSATARLRYTLVALGSEIGMAP